MFFFFFSQSLLPRETRSLRQARVMVMHATQQSVRNDVTTRIVSDIKAITVHPRGPPVEQTQAHVCFHLPTSAARRGSQYEDRSFSGSCR